MRPGADVSNDPFAGRSATIYENAPDLFQGNEQHRYGKALTKLIGDFV
jgi:hypothetical protein